MDAYYSQHILVKCSYPALKDAEENHFRCIAIRFAEECYIEGIIPIQKVKRLAEFYLVEESERTIEWQEARKRIEDTLNSYTKKEEKQKK